MSGRTDGDRTVRDRLVVGAVVLVGALVAVPFLLVAVSGGGALLAVVLVVFGVVAVTVTVGTGTGRHANRTGDARPTLVVLGVAFTLLAVLLGLLAVEQAMGILLGRWAWYAGVAVAVLGPVFLTYSPLPSVATGE